MLATFGLSRLESRLDTSSETVTAADVAAMLKGVLTKTKNAYAASSTPLSHRTSPSMAFDEPRALPQRDTSLDVSNYVLPCSMPVRDGRGDSAAERPSPSVSPARHTSNPQFRQTRHANRV